MIEDLCLSLRKRPGLKSELGVITSRLQLNPLAMEWIIQEDLEEKTTGDHEEHEFLRGSQGKGSLPKRQDTFREVGRTRDIRKGKPGMCGILADARS